MNPLKNIEIDYSSYINVFELMDCPEPNFKKIAKLAKESDDFVKVVSGAANNLCSGLYFLGLLASKNIKKNSYTISSSEIEKYLVGNSEVVFIDGDLTITDNLLLKYNLIVTGDLVINGIFEDVGDESKLAVIGDFKCEGISTTGWVIIGGDTTVSGYIYAYYNDDEFECLGTVKAKAIITEDHSLNIGEAITEVMAADPESYFGPNVFDIRNEIDRNYIKEMYNDELSKVLPLDQITIFD